MVVTCQHRQLNLFIAAPFKMWTMAVEELSQDVFDSYF